MGYTEQTLKETRGRKQIVGAVCDGCGLEMSSRGHFWQPPLVLRVQGGLASLYRPTEAPTLELTYCYACAEKVIESLAGLRAGLGLLEEGEAMG